MITGRRREARLAGFTLLEMLVVVTLLALVAVVIVPPLARPSDNFRLQSTARDVVGALRLTRGAAILRGTEMTVVIDVDKRTVESPVMPQKTFFPEVVAQLRVAEPERIAPARGGFRFFPDGSSTGGDVALTLRDKKVSLCVNWMTGLAQVEASC
jgi:general secretion pathway protein H